MTWNEYATDLFNAVASLKTKTTARPDIGVVLGSGPGGYGTCLANPLTIPFTDIRGLPAPTVPGHSGRIVFGSIGSRTVVCLCGRSHLYESLHPHEVQFGVRLLALLGCRLVILTAAVGCSLPESHLGDLIPIVDHANFTHRGYGCPAKDFRHLIQTDMYDTSLHELVSPLRGVYSQCLGPSFETPLETAGLTSLGVSLFGMSTVPEVVALKEMGVPVLAIGFVSNVAVGFSEKAVSSYDATATVKEHEAKFNKSLTRLICEAKLRDFPIPTFHGCDLLACPRAEVLTKTEVIEAAIDSLLPGQKVDALIVLAGKHRLSGFVPVCDVPLLNLADFPIGEHVNAKIGLGVFSERTVAVVGGLSNLCGFSSSALRFLCVAFRHIGAKAVVCTFHSGGFEDTGPSVVADLNPLFDDSPIGSLPPVSSTDLRQCVLACYHGPEFPSPFEVDLLRKTGATQVTLGTANGLVIGHDLGLESLGVADGAISLPFRADDTLSSVLERCADSSPAVSRIIAGFIAGLDARPAQFVTPGVGGRALVWNDLPQLARHEQEDESEVSQLAAALPAADGIIVLPNERALASIAAGTREITITGHVIREAAIAGRPVLLAASDNCLIRAAARQGLPIVLLSTAAGAPSLAGPVCVSDHADLTGRSPLCGRNLSGARFPSLEGLYRRVDGLPAVALFRSAGAAFALARAFGADLVSDFGPPQAVVARHAGAPSVAHICAQEISLDVVPPSAFSLLSS
jgi:purine-nucleoside phosphorylase